MAKDALGMMAEVVKNYLKFDRRVSTSICLFRSVEDFKQKFEVEYDKQGRVVGIRKR